MQDDEGARQVGFSVAEPFRRPAEPDLVKAAQAIGIVGEHPGFVKGLA